MTRSPLLKAVIFDFDGTLTASGAIDFLGIKKEMDCPADQTILEFLAALPPDRRRTAETILERHEEAAASVSVPNDGAEALLAGLRTAGIPVAILTRNRREHILRSLENFPATTPDDFAVILCRDDAPAPKPSPEGVLEAARRMGVQPEEILVVGDYLFDIEAGRRAGAMTVHLTNGVTPPYEARADHAISGLPDLLRLIRRYRPLANGKFPNDLLRGYLDDVESRDPSVIIHPGVGEDIAAVDVSGEEVLILKSDPITFATDAIGHYAVLVNANDIATSGATPRWLLTTLLFPPGSTPAEILTTLGELREVCGRWGITLCGGHTEITDAVTRPVISGMLAGTVPRRDLIDKKSMRPGDRVLMTKAVAVEGTSIIAREFGDRLLALGVPEEEITACAAFLDRISILEEARVAAMCDGVTAMHDVTEGGLATALSELAIAGGHRIRVRMENIPVYPQTAAIGRLLGIEPLGLIGSGSLLIACRPDVCGRLIRDIHAAGVQVTYIGEVLEPGEDVEALWESRPVAWPRFEVDEITRLFS